MPRSVVSLGSITEDPLGPAWRDRVMTFPDDDEGPVVATLVQRAEVHGERPAVLYVHGYVDYFFQEHLAQQWEDHGFAFYAIDLRKYGRSLLPHQTPNYCTDLREYWADLDAAIHILRAEYGHKTVILNAHSTGGLITSLWAHYRRGRGLIDGLTLNSPWFDLNESWFARTIGTVAIDVIGAKLPKTTVGNLDSSYGKSLHRSTGGAWEYDLRWKPLEGFGAYSGWLRAVRRGHARIARGLDIDVPVQVCCSTESGPNDRPHPDIDRTDSVLNVRHIAERAVGLGSDVTIRRIRDGIHDLSLSAPAPRAAYFEALFRWVEYATGPEPRA